MVSERRGWTEGREAGRNAGAFSGKKPERLRADGLKKGKSGGEVNRVSAVRGQPNKPFAADGQARLLVDAVFE